MREGCVRCQEVADVLGGTVRHLAGCLRQAVGGVGPPLHAAPVYAATGKGHRGGAGWLRGEHGAGSFMAAKELMCIAGGGMAARDDG